MKCLFRSCGHLWLVLLCSFLLPARGLMRFWGTGNFPGCPGVGSPVVWEGIHWEERAGARALLLQRGWLLATLAENPDSWRAGGLACHCGMLNYTGNWKPRSGPAPSAQPQAWTPCWWPKRYYSQLPPSPPCFFFPAGESADLWCSILAAFLFAQGWSPSIYPCDFLKIRYITFPSINKVGTAAPYTLPWWLFPAPSIPRPVPVLSDDRNKQLAEHV